VCIPEGQAQVKALISLRHGERRRSSAASSAPPAWQVYGGEQATYVWIRSPEGLDSGISGPTSLLSQAHRGGDPAAASAPPGEGYFRLSAFNSRANCWRRPMRRDPGCRWLDSAARVRAWSRGLDGRTGSTTEPSPAERGRGGAAVMEKAPERVRKPSPRYKVLLHDDPVNTMEYVVTPCGRWCPQPDEQDAIAVMLEAAQHRRRPGDRLRTWSRRSSAANPQGQGAHQQRSNPSRW
jgi:hypothetical protein